MNSEWLLGNFEGRRKSLILKLQYLLMLTYVIGKLVLAHISKYIIQRGYLSSFQNHCQQSEDTEMLTASVKFHCIKQIVYKAVQTKFLFRTHHINFLNMYLWQWVLNTFKVKQPSVLRATLQSSTKANQSCTAVMEEGNSTLEQLSTDQVTIRKKV